VSAPTSVSSRPTPTGSRGRRPRPHPGPSGRPRTAARAARISPNALLAAIACGAVAVLALWWHDTAFVSGLGDWLTNAGRVSGLLTGYGVIVLLALMARVPAIERGVGTDRLTRWHAHGGRYVVCLAVAHTLLIIWGYAVTAHTGVVHQTGLLLTTYPDVLMAMVALGLLIAVGISSARAARRRMHYETWQFVHLYTYLAVGLAFAHQFATGADFIDDAVARWVWSGLHTAVAALLVRYRVAEPLLADRRHRLRVADVRPETTGVVSVYVTGRRLDELVAEPGQFFRWRFLTRELWWAANPYSLSAPPNADLLRITVKCTGEHSAALLRLPRGTRVIAEGPYGALTAARRRSDRVLFIAGGVGITPLRAMFETVAARPGELSLLYRARAEDDLLFRAELERIAHERGARLHYLLGASSSGADALLSAPQLRELVPRLDEHDVFLCGPPGMTALARRSLRQAGVARNRIHEESFAI
jgi:ferredoxin-NADP reductase/DMSO/TMAO reductase YedYZ heme-binding membrane subunit